MSVDPTPTFESILAFVRDSVPFPDRVYDGAIPSEKSLPRDASGNVLPFISVWLGGPVRWDKSTHITSSRADSYLLYATIDVFGPNAKIVRQVKGQVLDGLLGRVPTNGTEIQLVANTHFPQYAQQNRPAIYYESVGLACFGNMAEED